MRPLGLFLIGMVAACEVAACGDDTGPPDARQIDGPPAGGTVSLSWSIADQGTSLTCAQVGSTLVSVTMVPRDNVFGITDAFGCAAGQATSRSVPGGVYDVSVTLGGVDVEPIEFAAVTVVSGEDTPLGNAAFEVEARGGFAFRIATGQSNCGDGASGGAGITAMQIDLATTGGTCVPVTFQIAAGASQPASMYTTDCTTPLPTTCIAEDQQITVAPTVATGGYRMTITGSVGAASCWSRVAQFDVPAAEETENLPQQTLVLDTNNPACVNP